LPGQAAAARVLTKVHWWRSQILADMDAKNFATASEQTTAR
jgi:hypothetical protein